MRRANMSAEARTQAGKGVARKARAAGRLPSVVYGEGQPPQPLTVERRTFERLMVGVEGRNVLVNLKVGDEPEVMTLVKDIQYDPLSGEMLHVDFLRVSTEHRITTEVPVRLIGSSVGVREGGIMEFAIRQVEVECLPQDIPDSIELGIAELQMGHSLHVRDLPTSEKFRILTDPDRTVVSVISTARLEAAAQRAEAAAAEAVAGEGEAAAAEEGKAEGAAETPGTGEA